MDDETRFFFDLRGWVLLPAVLTRDEVDAIREHLLAGGDSFSGPAQMLLDHPSVVDVLNDILSDRPQAEDHYNFRCESSFVTIRKAGWQAKGGTQRPHVVLPPQRCSPMNYQCRGDRIYSGLTRVVWELNPVRRGMGGTLFLSGTHKANFAFPDAVREPENRHMESYECPAGSVFIFSESLLHAAARWTDPDIDRVAVFNCYNSIWAQWHKLHLPHETISSMPPKRQSLFRGVYAIDFSKPAGEGANRQYAMDNRSL